MSKFVLQGRDESDFQSLDEFTQAYITALFWTDEAPGVTTEQWQTPGYEPTEGSIPGDVGFADLAPDTLFRIVEECKLFQLENADALQRAYATQRDGYGRALAYDESQAGHDFWLTRNHHGVGFWDRNLGDVGETLTQAAHAYAECDSYLGDDGKVYLL